MNPKFKKLISYYKPYKKQLILDLVFSAISSLIYVVAPIVCHFITSEVFGYEKSEAIKTISLLSGLVFVLFTILYFLKKYSEYQGNVFAAKIETDIKDELFEHLQKQSFDFYDKNKIGKLIFHLATDTFNIAITIKNTPEIFLSCIIRFSGSLTFLFLQNIVFGFVFLVIFIMLFIFMGYNLPRIYRANKSSREIFSDLTSNVEEDLSGIKTIQSFSGESSAMFNFRGYNKKYIQTVDKMYKIQGVLNAGLFSFILGLAPIATVIASFFVVNGFIAIPDLITLTLFIGISITPFFEIQFLSEFMRDGLLGFNRIYETLNIKPKIFDVPGAVELQNINGNIEFKDVIFHYEKAGKNIFQNLNLKINSGEYIALAGSSGVGKSSLCNLIPRFYDVSSGKILIDGVNIKNIKLKNLRQNIGFVQQDTFLFSGTIIENIRYGKPDATNEEIFEAAKNAYAHEFIMSFPDGYDTAIGQKGAKLSGGQKQRLAIARVFLKNPPILIFDEATSSLDNESERYIQKSMEKLAINRTTIVIAHRLSTIKNAKRILVMADGKIAEEGTHDELLAKNGVYAEFYSLL
jgi:ATP-binding cassette subfamily B protein